MNDQGEGSKAGTVEGGNMQERFNVGTFYALQLDPMTVNPREVAPGGTPSVIR